MRKLEDPSNAWHELLAEGPLDKRQSEEYLDIAVSQWLLTGNRASAEGSKAFARLAAVIIQNHGDFWLRDFLRSPSSRKADEFLGLAVRANYSGDTESAIQCALRARALYGEAKNIAGASRSQAELVYALRRQSKARQCLVAITFLDRLLQNHGYKKLETASAYETSACHNMLSDFDLALHFAHLSAQRAEAANYPSDALRPRGMESNVFTTEGQASSAWLVDTEGLDLFWQGVYRAERAFQLYSDLQEASERSQLWRLSAVLQQEAITMLNETERNDFKAIAHFRLGLLHEEYGEDQQAQNEFVQAASIFARLPRSPTTALYQVFGEVELARLQAATNPLISMERLRQYGPAVSEIDNIMVRMPYYRALAEVERRLNQPTAESEYLKEGIRIGERGLGTLRTEQERWQQWQQIDKLYHRFLELKLRSSESSLETFGEWEFHRAGQLRYSRMTEQLRVPQVRNHLLKVQLKSLNHSTLISFSVFHDWTNVWVADDRGIHRIELKIEAETLEHEVRRFLSLCSDASSPIEKVNASGRRLYEMLIAPIETFLEQDRMLLIEEDAPLQNIPWSALMINGVYLGDRYRSAITPGLFYNPAGHRETVDTHGTLLVYPGSVTTAGQTYPALPDARKEIELIASLIPSATRLDDDRASLERTLHEMKSAALFHFAGHRESLSVGGALVLRDGALSAAALKQMHLPNMQLAVLSACSTTLAAGDPSRDPDGLVRAFQAAGATQVVATHWDVDSHASFTFAKIFYSELVSTHDVAAAIAAAHKEIRSDPALAHPFYWSAFEVYGAPR